ncbi:kinase-like protein [Mytilinidion resinicola]|uniref:Kinase-like protein n=1 Tax=Mytilinidion resinicola TaxID=574789 RepID=A0A6A6Z7T5_9PEZI|nr:kinase-like protein [Mytilinidion resinicola]KAF2816763.1 kinase-like protein [Mytilinidion resinicola]
MPRGSDKGFSDAEIQEISGLLSDIECSWSQVPRTYIILRTIGHLQVIEELLAVDFSDHWFPVTVRNLPPTRSLTPSIRSAIVDNQKLILTKSIDLEKGENGRHRHFEHGDVLPFQDGDILGTGTYGRVDKVLSLISYKKYARKSIYRAGQSAASIRQFANEVQILKSMKHPHVVELMGSYTDPVFFAIIMSPVADMDFSKYLEMCQQSSHHTLRTYFGCLATALQYLHRNNIRHKDIKPQNILIHGSDILFTDFGLSRDTTGADSASSGFTGYTPRYCAPEVTEYDSRSYPSDIWSLGCVFLEMLAVLKGQRLQWMKDFYAARGTGQPFVRTNTEATVQLLAALEEMEQWSDNSAIQWVEDMTQRSPQRRPTAAALVKAIMGSDRQRIMSPWCGLCCTHEEEPARGVDDLSDEFFERTVR